MPRGRAETTHVLGRLLVAILSLATGLRATPAWTYASSLDPSFGQGGLVREELTPYAASTGAEAVAFDAEGRLVVAGNLCRVGYSLCGMFVARFNEDGSRSLPFGPDGVASLAPSWSGEPGGLAVPGALPDPETEGYAYATSMALDREGRIVVAGNLWMGDQYHGYAYGMAVARFTPDGFLDTSFGAGGLVKLDVAPGQRDRAEAVAIDPRGGIVVAGVSSTVASQYNWDENVTVLRLLDDGSLDPGFGVGGVRSFGSSDKDESASSMVIDRYGRIVVAGTAHTGESPSVVMLVLRFLPDGTPDPSFGPANSAQVRIGPAYYPLERRATGVALDSHDRILVAGVEGRSSVLASINPDGKTDPREVAPGAGGYPYFHTFYYKHVDAMTIDSKDRVVVAGTYWGETPWPYPDVSSVSDRFPAFIERSGDDPWSPDWDIAYRTPDTGTPDAAGFAHGLSALLYSVDGDWKDIAVDAYGRVVVVGSYRHDYIDAVESELVVARYLGEPWTSASGSVCLTCSSAPPAVCGNGLFEFGEQCDDGNTTDGDGCSAACAIESDDDADGLLDEVYDYCVNVGGTQDFLSEPPSAITITRSTTSAGTSEALTVSGVVQMPSGWHFGDFDPNAVDRYSGGRGVEVMVSNGVPSRILFGVVADDGPDRTWTRTTATSWRYLNRFPDDASPFVEIQLSDVGSGRVSVLVKARKSQFLGALGSGFDPLPLEGSVTFGRRQGVGQYGECGEVRYAPAECRVSASGASVECRRPTAAAPPPAARPAACGLGPELAFLVPLITALQARVRRRRAAI